jgi:group I intron endonuclease
MFIYKFTNSINQKIYIGLTTRDLEQRIREHLQEASVNDEKVFHKAINKYGFENFSLEVLESGIQNKEILKEKEIYYIKKFNSHYLTG